MSDLVQQLANRLPELEWKLSCLGLTLKPSLFPRGLFRSRLELTSQSCIDEIKADLQMMKQLTRSSFPKNSPSRGLSAGSSDRPSIMDPADKPRDVGSERSVQYLAVRVEQKINVLVRICQQSLEKKTPQREVYFGVQAISTRQQWLKSLQDEVDTLSHQHQALETAISTSKANNNIQTTLSLEKELGEAYRRLTLAKEMFSRHAAS